MSEQFDFENALSALQSGQNLVRKIPQRRLGMASDLDGLLLLLASPASGFMTGAAINIDGGHSLLI